ncbi:hypothetical protein [Cryptosporangium sp. NPDC051539]|uniref:hypothetical protein n=1 Tax=Cryptosporangium sp. NPDC051539 TaxID=3363962 RepID=UPI00379C0CFE
MRIKTMLAVGALTAVTLIGSASAAVAGESTPPPSGNAGGSTSFGYTSTGGDAVAEARKFSACVRRNGVPDFPDPKVTEESGGKTTISLRLPEGFRTDKVDAATEKCRKYAPPKGAKKGVKVGTKNRGQLVKLARCMRARGISNFPMPKSTGELSIDANKLGIDPESSKYKAAERACQKYLPKGGQKQDLRHARPAPDSGTAESGTTGSGTAGAEETGLSTSAG